MSVRIKELWRARKARKARINEQLARADQAERQEWVDRTRIPEQWSPEMLDKLDGMLHEPGEWDAS